MGTGQGGGGVVSPPTAARSLPARSQAALARQAGRTCLGEFAGTGIHYAPPLMDARLWAGKRQRWAAGSSAARA